MMLNIQSNPASGKDDRNGPGNAQFSTSSRHSQTKGSQNNGYKKKFHASKTPQAKAPIQVNSQNLEGSLNETMASLRVSNDSEENDANTPKTKRKGSRKKNKKQLHLITQVKVPNPSPQSAPISISTGMNSSVHNFFSNYSSATFSNTSPGYLENLTHHPQYQYMQHVQNVINIQNTYQNMAMKNNQYVGVPPYNLQETPASSSMPCSPQLQHLNENPINMQFYQNMMQHPMFNQSFTNSNLNLNVKSKKKVHMQKIKQSKKNNNDNDGSISENKRFEDYWPLEKVVEGLKNNTLFEGTLRINPKQFQHGYISSLDRDEQDIFIDGVKNRNRALEGDVVVVQLIETEFVKLEPKNVTTTQYETKIQIEDDNGVEVKDAAKIVIGTENHTEIEVAEIDKDQDKKQKRGKVVCILEKVHKRTCVGNLKLMPDKSRQKALFVPRDHRVPRLNIPFTCWPDNFYNEAKNYENTLFSAKIVDWFDIRFALGKILINIGQSGDMKTETTAILAENDLDITPFGPEVRHLFPRLDYVVPQKEIDLREDCRKLCIYSVDPSNCRDIDDALSCRQLENGNYEIGVHISDVAHYLAEDTLLDTKVSLKATTIYMVERAYHMLPDELCMLCSLFPGVDKLAFSVFWEITEDGQVLNHRFAKTVINSCSQLAYGHAQSVLEGKDNAESTFPETYNGFQFQDIKKSIQVIGGIAALIRKRRFSGGALRIDQPKAYFHLNPDNGLPDSYHIHESQESHQMIEEFMLLANMTVARRIYEDHPKLAFLRSHPPPSSYMLRNLAKALKPMGIELDITSAGDLHRSLLPHVSADCIDKGKALALNMLCAKPMTRAKYFCADGCDDEDFHHYALNVPLYTHFTSPIRRYADIMVHRLLSASLKYRDTPSWEVDKVRMVAAQCNKQKYNAKRAGEMSTEMYMLKYIEMNSPFETEVVVVEVKQKYIDVIVIEMGLNRRIFFNSDFPGEFKCVKNEGSSKMTKMELKWRAGEGKPEVLQVIEVFSVLKVLLAKADDAIKIETKLIRPNVV